MAEKSINLVTETYVNNAISDVNLKIKKLAELVDSPPVYANPSIGLTLSTTIAKHNEETTVIITPSYTQNDAGEITEFILKKGEEILVTSDNAIQRYTDKVTLKHGENIVYSAIISYADGKIKNTTLGEPYPETSIKAGTIAKTNMIKGYANTFIGVASINENGEDEISIVRTFVNTTKDYSCILSLVDQRIVYMYPSSYGELTSIKDINNFDYINSYAKTVSTYDGVDYFVYIMIDPVTITEFKQAFS